MEKRKREIKKFSILKKEEVKIPKIKEREERNKI